MDHTFPEADDMSDEATRMTTGNELDENSSRAVHSNVIGELSSAVPMESMEGEASLENGGVDLGRVQMDCEPAQAACADSGRSSDAHQHFDDSNPESMDEGEALALDKFGSTPDPGDVHSRSPHTTRMPFQEITSRFGNENVGSRAADEEKDQKMDQTEAEVQELRQLVESLRKERVEAEEARRYSDTRLQELQVEVEAAKSTVHKVTADFQAQHEAHEEQQASLNEVMKKLDVQSLFLNSGSVEADRAKDCIELEARCRDLTQRLAENDSMLRNMRENHERARTSFGKKEKTLAQEKEEIIAALEASDMKSQDQAVKLQELENNIGRIRGQAANLEKRCKTAEAKAADSSVLLDDLQGRLDSTTMELFELKNSSAQHDILKLRLQECERALSLATTQKALAESSLRDLKAREEHIDEVEKGNRDLGERLKWRNEQFGSLEEAHSKLRSEFKEERSLWDREKSGLLSEMDSLQSTLDSKERMLHDVQNQLQMVHHALSHEESRRKALEAEASEWREGLEKASAGCEAAESSMLLLREQSSTEIGMLRMAVGEKDRQLKDSHIKFVQMEQEFADLKEMEQEYRAWQSGNGEQQRKLRSLEERMAKMVEVHDNLRVRMKEQEKGFEQESKNLVDDLGVANESLASKDEALKQRDIELNAIKGAFEVISSQRSGLEARLLECEKQLEEACEEAANLRDNLASLEIRSQAEATRHLETLHGKEKVVQDLKAKISAMDQTIADLSMREEMWAQMEKDHESLKQQQTLKHTEHRELVKIHESFLGRAKEEKASWEGDREKLVMELELRQQALNEAEKKLEEVHWNDDRHRDAIRKLEERCHTSEKDLAAQLQLVDQARGQLEEGNMEKEILQIEVTGLKESLSAAVSHKDLMNQRLSVQIEGLEAEILQKDKEAGNLQQKVSTLEKKVQENLDSRINMQEHIAAMKSESGKMTEEIRTLEEVRDSLEGALRALRKEHAETTKHLEGKLEIAYKDLSISSNQLKSAKQRLEEVTAHNEVLIRDLDERELALSESMEARKSLTAEKESLQQIAHALEAKKLELLQEVENGRITINQLCDKYEAAQANFESSRREAKELRVLLQNVHKVSEKLQTVEEQKRELEGYVQAARGIAQEKEESLAASEWAIQQLALDIGKAKAALIEKEREEALLRFQLEDVERQLSEKEGILIEMECYVHEAVVDKETLQCVVDKLHQEMEHLNKGAGEWKKKEQDMVSQLELLGAALEGKREELDATEVKLKRSDDQREVMDGAIESLKRSLAEAKDELSAQQHEGNKLCDHLERCQSEASSSAERVKELHGRLQQLEQSSDEHIKRFQSTLFELNDELSLAYTQLQKSQDSVKTLTEESSRLREKCDALSHLNTSQYASLKDMEAEMSRVQGVVLDQSTGLEGRDRELQQAAELLQHQDVRVQGLEDSLSKVQSQRSDLQVENEELIHKLTGLTARFDRSSSDLALKSKEIDGLKIQLEQMRMLVAQEGETEILLTKLSEELEASRCTAQEREVRVNALQAALDGAQVELKVLQDSGALKDTDNDLLQQKLSAAEKQCEENLVELLNIQEGLSLADKVLAEKSAVISSYVAAMTAAETEREELRSKAEINSKEMTSLVKQLQDASSSALQSQERLSETDGMLKDLQMELDESREKLLTQITDMHLLEGDVKALKEASVAASEEKEVLLAALAKAEVTMQEKGVAIESLREALTAAESGISSHDVIAGQLQAELALLRGKEAAVEEERGELMKQLDASRRKAESNQLEIVELQATLQNSLRELEDKTQKIPNLVSTISGLQEELVGWKAKVAGTESEVESLQVRLQESEAKALLKYEEALQSQEALTILEQVLSEERKNSQRLTGFERDLVTEKIKAAESASLVYQLQSELKESTSKASSASAAAEALKQEVLHLKEAKMEVDEAILEEKKSTQHLASVERCLESEKTRAADLDRLVADSNKKAEEWKAKVVDAETKAGTMTQELSDALGKLSSLTSQLESHQAEKRSMQELNDSLQASLNATQEELLARKEKMAAVLHELEESQHNSRELFRGLHMAKVIQELDDDEDWAEEKACDTVQIQCDMRKVSGGVDVSKSPTTDEVHEHFLVESQASQAFSQTRLNDGVEQEVEALRLRSEASHIEVQQLFEKLDAAQSTVSAKNLIIKQVTDEIGDLRSQVKALEEAAVKKLAQSTSATMGVDGEEFQECSNLASEGEGAGLGKRKAERQEELNHYLELCDSLVRKNIRLEKQVDGLQRKNRGLQKQAQGLQTDKTATDKERRALDTLDCSPEQKSSRKSHPNVLRLSIGQDVGKATSVLGEVDENAAPVNFERSQISRRPPSSPVASIQSKRARRLKDES